METTLLSVCDVIDNRPYVDMDIEYDVDDDDSKTFLAAFVNNVDESQQMLEGILSFI